MRTAAGFVLIVAFRFSIFLESNMCALGYRCNNLNDSRASFRILDYLIDWFSGDCFFVLVQSFLA